MNFTISKHPLGISQVPYGVNVMTEDDKNIAVIYRSGDCRNVITSGTTEDNKKVISLMRPSEPVDGNINPKPGDRIDSKTFEQSNVEKGDQIHLVFDNKVSLNTFIKRLQRCYDSWNN